MLQRVLGALRLASHAGEKRLLEYSLIVDPDASAPVTARFDLAGTVIEGRKTFTYGRRSNPWRQLSQMRLTKMQGLIGEKDTPPLLCLDTRFLSRINVPLIRLTAQQDQVNAMLDLFSLGAYLARMMIGIHLWSFRKPDAPLPDVPDRLPGPITGLPRPGTVEIQVDTRGRDLVDPLPNDLGDLLGGSLIVPTAWTAEIPFRMTAEKTGHGRPPCRSICSRWVKSISPWANTL